MYKTSKSVVLRWLAFSLWHAILSVRAVSSEETAASQQHKVRGQQPQLLRRDPRFRDYPALPVSHARSAVDQAGSYLDALPADSRAAMDEALRNGTNFAGHYTLVELPCGTSCATILIVDRYSGQTYNPDHDERGAEFRPDSSLLILDPPMSPKVNAYRENVSDTLPVRYFVWKKEHLRLVSTKPCWIAGQHQACGFRRSYEHGGKLNH